jgi:cytochrome c-type biogenesis protein
VTVSLGLAFLAGLASFLTPCVFSLMPAYIGYLGGRSFSNSQSTSISNRWSILLHGMAFILGFSLVFIGMGLTASFIGSLLFEMKDWLAKIGGVVVILFGLHMTGIICIPWLEYDLRPKNRMEKNRSFLSSLLMGVFFSAGWSPCVGPVLGSILTLAVDKGSISEGVRLLTAYSTGFAIPFLATALGIEWISNYMQPLQKTVKVVEKVMGAILICVGVLLFFGLYEQFARFGFWINTGL